MKMQKKRKTIFLLIVLGAELRKFTKWEYTYLNFSKFVFAPTTLNCVIYFEYITLYNLLTTSSNDIEYALSVKQ